MKRRKLIFGLGILVFTACLCSLNAQISTRSTGTTTRDRGTTSTTSTEDSALSRTAAVNDLLIAYIVGGMLRHPDPTVRKQAIQSLARGLSVSGTDSSDSDTGGARGRLFSGGSTDTSDEATAGLGATIYIPDLYVLLSDPDPEVRDLASAGLDLIMGTDVTLLRLMNDSEPLIRNYATKIYATRNFSSREDTSSTEQEYGNINELLALRTMLVRLKHETNIEVRKTIVDAIEWYIKRGGEQEGEGRGITGMFGVDTAILKYLDDPNPEIRKNAVRVISGTEASYDMLIRFMEKMKVEEDEGVKKELQKAIDNFIRKHQATQGGVEEGTSPEYVPPSEWSFGE